MIEETALVSKVIANQAWVNTGYHTGCGLCAEQTSCSTQWLTKFMGKREIPVNTDLVLEQGDKIVVAIDESQLIKGALLIYIVPLLALFLGAFLGKTLANFWLVFNPDLVISITAIACFGLVLLAINRWQNFLSAQLFANPVVLRKLTLDNTH